MSNDRDLQPALVDCREAVGKAFTAIDVYDICLRLAPLSDTNFTNY